MENPEDLQDASNQEEKMEEETGSGVEDVSDEEEEGEEEDDDDAEDDDEEWESGEDEGEDSGAEDDEFEEEDDDDDDGDDDGDEEAVLEASDSDGESAERCPVCLNRFRDQDVGTPEACDHMFCLECIQEWSKNVNTCPVDRQVFRLILCKHGVDDVIYKKITVEDTNKQAEEEEEEEPTYCEVCHQCDREDRLLLCDGCDLGYHLECLTPPLNEVPVEEWFCPNCARREGISQESDADYVPHGMSRYRRQIPRTLVMERVRSAIEERRVRRTQNMRRLLSSDEEEGVGEEALSTAVTTSPASASASSPTKKSPAKKTTKRKIPRRYKKRKRKSTSKKTTKKRKVSKTGKRKRKRKYRKGKKGKKAKKLARTAKPCAVTTVKTRIAGALGLTNPPPGRTIPLQKPKQEKSLDMRRTDIGAASLSIFGSRDEIIHFEDEQSEPVSSSTESAATRKYSRLALSSYKPIGRVPAILPVREKKKIVIKTSLGGSGGGVDLLGSIMQDQSKLHMSGKDVTIHRDGSLTTKPLEGSEKTGSKPSDRDSVSQSLFKSSFTAVTSSSSKQSSVLSSLSSPEKAKSKSSEKEAAAEAYDPAHPTDELEDDMENSHQSDKNQLDNEDVYDPAHPTDDISSDEEELNNLESGDVNKINFKRKGSTSKKENAKELEKMQMENEKKDKVEDKNKENTSCEVKKAEETKEKIAANTQTSECLKAKGKSVLSDELVKTTADISSQGTLVADKKDAKVFPKKPETLLEKEEKTLKSNTTVKTEKESPIKKSPSIKITETSKKSSIKPFEISRKTLFEKRRLYGGEIDFSEDVDFSEGAFPESFELNVKRIEEVFKGTKAKQDKESKKAESETKVIDLEKAVVEKVDKESVEQTLSKDKVEKDKNSSRKEGKVGLEEKKAKSEKDSKEKMKFTGKFKPISANVDENIGTTKISVSDRFKKISEERNSPEMVSLEEEDPIHEMRKLDKELDLEFGNSGFSKKKEKDKETRKNKRKVSLDDNESEHRIRRESKENREKKKGDSDYIYEEKEEGEVEDEYKLKEKKKRDRKKKKERDRFHDSDFKENADSDIDRRIVIQVSQNTEDRTVWEEAERQRKKRDREERKREKEKYKESDKDIRRERKYKRLRSRSRSRDKRNRSRSRDRKRSKSRSRDRDRSRERARRKHRGRSRSRSRDWSYERSRKKKKRDRNRSKERDASREWSHDRSKDRDWSRERDLSSERERAWSRGHSRDRRKSREHSEDRVDMFGRSRSPYTRRELLKTKQNLTPRKKLKQLAADDEVIEILDSTPPPKKPTYDEVSSSESEKEEGQEIVSEKIETVSKSEIQSETKSITEKIETISRIGVKESSTREASSFADSDDKDDEFDDEPEETEQFQYTDRDEFLGQNKSKQMRQNLITIGVSSSDYDPANPTETTSPAPPPLPEPMSAPTPPLPPGGDFTQFPPPPPGPPPQGPPPGSVIIQEHPPIHVQASGQPGQGILGEGPILLPGPPPSLDTGPPPSIIQQRPPMSVPVNINVLPPGFHRGLPPTITPQRQVIVSPLRPAAPRVQRLGNPGGVRFGWQVTTTSEVIPSQFGSRIPSPASLPGHPLLNGPFDSLPPPQSEALPPQNLPPGHPQFPPPSVAPGEPHVIAIKTKTPPPNIVQIPVEVNEAQRHIHPTGPEPQLIHLGPDPRAPQPRLPIPLLPSTSEPPPMSVMVSIPPPNSSLMSMPPPNNNVPESFARSNTPPNSVSAILGLARMGTGSMPVVSSAVMQGLSVSSANVNGECGVTSMNTNSHQKAEGTLNELEKISELLSTQAQLMAASKQMQSTGDSEKVSTVKSGVPIEIDVFKVPLVPVAKSGGKNEADATEVVDMDMGSPINEEGNIELPVSPQFDNLIDNPEDLLEEDFNKKMQKLHEKDVKHEKNNVKETKSKDVKNTDSKKDSPLKTKDEKHRHDKRSSKENKHNKSAHKSRKHKPKPDSEKDLKEKALKDAHIDLDSQEVPSSAVEMTNKEKYLKKLHLQERVVEEVKMAIKPFYSGKKINKDQYKEILRKAVPKICHSKSGNINPMKIKHLVEAYVEKYTKHSDHSKAESDNFSPEITTNGERVKIAR